MDKKQIADREQFRRYAEAALAGGAMQDRAFRLATEMMLAEGQAFERYEILALEAITTNERERHAKGDF